MNIVKLAFLLLALLPSFAFSQETHWYPFFTRLTGFVNDKGVTVIPPTYDNAGDFSEGLAWVSQNLKYGFIDKAGRMVIEPQYNSAERFIDGTAKVSRDGKFGLVDKTGKEVLPLSYDDCRGFENGLAAVRTGDKWGFVDKTGQEKIAPQYDSVADFSSGLAAVLVKDNWGYINQEGKMVIQPQFGKACPFSEGMAFVCLQDTEWDYVLIDVKGASIPGITMYIDNQPRLHNGYALFSRCSGAPANCTHKVVDRKGKLVYEVDIQYKPPPSMNPDQTPITEVAVDKLTPAGKSPDSILSSLMPKYVKPEADLKKIRAAKKIRFFDQDGKVVPGQEYEGGFCNRVGPNDFWIVKEGRITLVENGKASPLTIDVSNMTFDFGFGEGLVSYRAMVKNPLYDPDDPGDEPVTVEKMGFFDRTGKMIVGPEYDELWHLSEGFAHFRKGQQEGFVRADGTEVNPAKVEGVGDFSEGLAPAEVDGKWGYVNVKGEMAIDPQFTEAGAFHDGFALVKEEDRMVDETIDPHGKVIAKFPNYNLNRYSNGLAAASDKNTKESGYIDKKGNWAIKPVFSWTRDFTEGLGFVSVKSEDGEKCGFVDEKGTFRFPPFEGYYSTEGFKGGLAILSGSGRSFVVDKTGKKIIEFNNQSETITPGQDGLFTVWNQMGMTKYYDRTGKLLFTNCFSEY